MKFYTELILFLHQKFLLIIFKFMQEITPEIRSEIDVIVQRANHI